MKLSTTLVLLAAAIGTQAKLHGDQAATAAHVGILARAVDTGSAEYARGFNDAYNNGVVAGQTFISGLENTAYNVGRNDAIAKTVQSSYAPDLTTAMQDAISQACDAPTTGSADYIAGYEADSAVCRTNFTNAYNSELLSISSVQSYLSSMYAMGVNSIAPLPAPSGTRMKKVKRHGDGTQW